MKISAVIVSNGQRYELGRALKCLDDQECKVDEVIIVDYSADDLSDSSMIESMDARYFRVEEELSKLQMCQMGIKESTGDYIFFLDSYDIWHKNKIRMVRDILNRDNKIDIIVHSYLQQVCTHQEIYSLMNYEKEDCTRLAVLQFLYAPSSVGLSRRVATCLEVIDLNELNSVILSEILSEHWTQACRDSLAMEKNFWKICRSEIDKLGLFEYGIKYCKSRFHATEDDSVMFQKMIQNEMISMEEFFILWNIRNEKINGMLQQKDCTIEKNHQNYLLMRNWLELKLGGISLSDKLVQKKINKVAIYGAGKHGTMLYQELSPEITVKCWIDKNKKTNSYLDVPVLNVDQISGQTYDIDAIIITPYREYDIICADLNLNSSIQLISLWDLVKE